MAKASTPSGAIKIVAENKKARFDYSIGDTFEAGLELRGSEVKSLRAGDVNLKDSYIVFKSGEAFLQNAHISVYKSSSYNNHEPERLRKLLLKATELFKIEKAIAEKGLTCVPLKVYFKGGWAKLEIALVKGKKAADKRESLKSRDADRELASARRKDR
ncbi:MAG: SsrA-binding protein SmpB [Bdellovibrionota bacterium]